MGFLLGCIWDDSAEPLFKPWSPPILMPTMSHASNPALIHILMWLEGFWVTSTWRRRGERIVVKKYFHPYTYSTQGIPIIGVKKIQGEEKKGSGEPIKRAKAKIRVLQEGPMVGSWSRTEDSTFEPWPTPSGGHSPSPDWNLSARSQPWKEGKDRRPLTVQSWLISIDH